LRRKWQEKPIFAENTTVYRNADPFMMDPEKLPENDEELSLIYAD
jgi:hypothetical protein